MSSAQELINQQARNARNKICVKKSREKKKKMIEQSIKNLKNLELENARLKMQFDSINHQFKGLKFYIEGLIVALPREKGLCAIKSVQTQLTSQNTNNQDPDSLTYYLNDLSNKLAYQPEAPSLVEQSVMVATNNPPIQMANIYDNEAAVMVNACDEAQNWNIPHLSLFLNEINSPVKMDKKAIQHNSEPEQIHSTNNEQVIDFNFDEYINKLLQEQQNLESLFQSEEILVVENDDAIKNREVKAIENDLKQLVNYLPSSSPFPFPPSQPQAYDNDKNIKEPNNFDFQHPAHTAVVNQPVTIQTTQYEICSSIYGNEANFDYYNTFSNTSCMTQNHIDESQEIFDYRFINGFPSQSG